MEGNSKHRRPAVRGMLKNWPVPLEGVKFCFVGDETPVIHRVKPLSCPVYLKNQTDIFQNQSDIF
jgi:hypothetical protein